MSEKVPEPPAKKPEQEPLGELGEIVKEEWWLFKVPEVFGAKWAKLPDGTNMGTANLKKRPIQALQATISLNEYAADLGSQLKLSATPPGGGQWLVMSETAPGDKKSTWKVEGEIKQKGAIIDDQNYLKISKDRFSRIEEEAKQVRVEGLERALIRAAPVVMTNAYKKVVDADKSKDRRERMEKGKLVTILHSCFERQARWPLKDLIEATQQPQEFLKEVLAEIADFNKRGAFKGLYERKAFYGGERESDPVEDPAVNE